MPQNLPHRESQIERLGSVLAPALTKDRVSNFFAYGRTGTGKTIVAKFVLERLVRKACQYNRALQTAHVNCRLAGTNYRVVADLCRRLGVQVPFTGLAVGELLDRLKEALRKQKTAFLVVLDEIDALVKRSEDDSLLYELTRINEALSEGWIGLIGIKRPSLQGLPRPPSVKFAGRGRTSLQTLLFRRTVRHSSRTIHSSLPARGLG